MGGNNEKRRKERGKEGGEMKEYVEVLDSSGKRSHECRYTYKHLNETKDVHINPSVTD